MAGGELRIWQWWTIYGAITAWLMLSAWLMGFAPNELFVSFILILAVDAAAIWASRRAGLGRFREDLDRKGRDDNLM